MTAALDTQATGLDVIPAASLADLEGEAALMTRTDRKYVVPADALPELVKALRELDPALRVLEIDGRRRHRYASAYLDTPALDAYWRSARRRRRRFKVRSRAYLDTGTVFTEVKTRGPRGSTVKTRVPSAGGGGRDVLAEPDTGFVHAELAAAGLADVDVDALVPTLRTSYLRTTLWLPSRHARVTLDVELAWSLPWDDTVVRVPGLAVAETKTAVARTGVDRALWSRGHRPVRISKYGTGLALVLPDLPAHRWHRVITGRFAPHVRQAHLQELS